MIPRWLQIFVGGSTADSYLGNHLAMISPANISSRVQSGE
jgi:hypothetical protein